VLVLTYPADPVSAPQIAELKKTARAMDVKLYIHDIRAAEDLPRAFDASVKERVEGLLTTIESIFVVHRARLLALAAEHKLPGIYVQQLLANDGGLMTYSDDRAALFGRAAAYVDRSSRVPGLPIFPSSSRRSASWSSISGRRRPWALRSRRRCCCGLIRSFSSSQGPPGHLLLA
jgi:hypothetical protein